MTASSSGGDGPELRIGDAEREAAVGALGEHYAAGRLSKEEFDERADAAWAARTSSALWPLFADLPRPPSARPGPAPRQPDGPHRDDRMTGRPYAGLWIGAWMVPLLILLGVLMVVTHLPVFLLLVVWLVWAKTHGHGPRRSQGPHGPHGPGPRGHGRRVR